MTGSSPLQRGIHATVPGGGDAPWRDNAFVSFWDPTHDLYGTLHVSTSSNAEGRRARLSLSVGGVVREVIEPLASGTFASESIAFDLASGTITAGAGELSVALETRPRLAIADFASGKAIPPMGGEPLQHFQSPVVVSGRCRLDGREIEVRGSGVRDRTWGHRDESVGIAEYAWFFLAFEEFSITAMRFIGEADFDRTDGFLLTADGAESVEGIAITRDPSGLCAAVTFDVSGRAPVEVVSRGRRAGFWIPMGPSRRGPAMSAFDEFAAFETADGARGFGLAEHGTVRRLF